MSWDGRGGISSPGIGSYPPAVERSAQSRSASVKRRGTAASSPSSHSVTTTSSPRGTSWQADVDECRALDVADVDASPRSARLDPARPPRPPPRGRRSRAVGVAARRGTRWR